MPNNSSKTSPLIIGHRGASAVAPENTLAALTRALDDGAAGLELDVRLASDGVPVVIHDANLRRTGLCPGTVATMTSGDLQKVDVGTWFNHLHPEFAQDEYGTQTIPTLAQVFVLFNQRPKPPEVVYVELKTDQDEATYVDLARAVTQLIKDHLMTSRAVVVSFNLKAVAQIKLIDSSITTGALFEPRRNPVKLIRRHPLITAALECGAEQVLWHRLIATRGLVELAAENNLRSVVWTVDDPKWLRRRAAFGIHAVITNKPAEMLASL
ncbi:MAG TPA: glycerophosphodiester phosphodiesterase family protein [Pyrinomonadaceae bacterium]|nr:glycerophosphodiester phosphodiesterase family protein [Pyrinomonadaceae bacterium]